MNIPGTRLGKAGTDVSTSVMLLLILVSVPLLVHDDDLAQAKQVDGGFCQIRSANTLAERAGMERPRVGIQLLTNHRKIRAGESVVARLANFATKHFLSGAEFKIQRYLGTKWVTDPSSPDGPWPRRARKLKPDEVGGCYRYVVPAGQPAGQYRFLTRVSKGSRKDSEAAKFSIRPRRAR